MVGGENDDVSVFAAMGIPADQWESMLAPEEFEVWPENWDAVRVFASIQTQWRIGMAGPTGLDYAVIPAMFEMFEIADRASCFFDVQVMEKEALETFGKQRGK